MQTSKYLTKCHKICQPKSLPKCQYNFYLSFFEMYLEDAKVEYTKKVKQIDIIKQ